MSFSSLRCKLITAVHLGVEWLKARNMTRWKKTLCMYATSVLPRPTCGENGIQTNRKQKLQTGRLIIRPNRKEKPVMIYRQTSYLLELHYIFLCVSLCTKVRDVRVLWSPCLHLLRFTLGSLSRTGGDQVMQPTQTNVD